jgi:hypothetical protein
MGAVVVPTYANFIADFPEFRNTSVFPEANIIWGLNLAQNVMNQNRWGSLFYSGAELFVAHWAQLQAQAALTVAAGGLPGNSKGPISGESSDKVSVNYDTGSYLSPRAGHWNLTTYGTRYYYLMLMVGSGPVQLGTGQFFGYGGSAWSGPICIPGWFGFTG